MIIHEARIRGVSFSSTNGWVCWNISYKKLLNRRKQTPMRKFHCSPNTDKNIFVELKKKITHEHCYYIKESNYAKLQVIFTWSTIIFFFLLFFVSFLFNFIQVTQVTERKIPCLPLLPVGLKEACWETILNINAMVFSYKCIQFSHIIKEKIFCINKFFTQLKHLQKHVFYIYTIYRNLKTKNQSQSK